MRPHTRPGSGGLSRVALLFLSFLASTYVVNRLYASSREIAALRTELEGAQQDGGPGRRELEEEPATDSPAVAVDPDPILFYSIRPRAPDAEEPPAPKGTKLEEHQPPVQLGDGSVLGQVDRVEAGTAYGWACLRGSRTKSLNVVLFVDGVAVAEAVADKPTESPVVHRLCEQDAVAEEGGEVAAGGHAGVRWAAPLPALPEGRHELRAFAVAPSGSHKRELNQSPLVFRESVVEPDQEEVLRRKDHIIQIRNAQIAALWDEVHTRQPWRNAVGARRPIAPFAEGDEDGKPGKSHNGTQLLAFFGINTGLTARARRDVLRRTWVPTGEALKDLEARRGVMIRFVVGYSEQKDDPMEKQIQAEQAKYGDIMRLDLIDTYADLSRKTLHLFGRLSAKIPADFYFKIDDDVAVNVEALADYLEERRGQGNLYLGCMKSGEVLTDKRWKWYEPEHWRFGDPAGGDGKINYMRHASGQIYGLSRPVARFLGQNEAILHRYANEDVGMGAWLVGTDIQYDNNRRLCCDNRWKCAEQSGKDNVCLAYYEHQCAGICQSDKRLEGIYRDCIKDGFNMKKKGKLPWWGASGWAEQTLATTQKRRLLSNQLRPWEEGRWWHAADAADGHTQQQTAEQRRQ